MKRKAVTILLVFIFLAGLSLMLYPMVFDAWNAMRQKKMIAQYEQAIAVPDVSPASAGGASMQEPEDPEITRARAYNARLKENFMIDLDDEAAHKEYMDILNPGGMQIMGVLNIPKIDVKLPIYHGTSDGVLQIGIGHLEGTSLPVGGYGSHCVLSGHTGLPSAKLLTDLNRLSIGDRFYMKVMNREYHYQIDQITVVLPDELNDLRIEPGKDYVTLVTCTPYGINSHRLLVRGRRVTIYSLPEVLPDAIRFSRNSVAFALAVPPSLLCILVGMIVIHKKEKREKRAAAAS